MISQGSSEHNISFVVSSRDAERAVQELHREFGLDGERG
jgi:aspartate kinase